MPPQTGQSGLRHHRLAVDRHRAQVVDVAHAERRGLGQPGQLVHDVEPDLAADQAAGRAQRRRRRAFAALLVDGDVIEREGAPVADLLAGEAAGHPRHVERPDPRHRREVAHRDEGDARGEAGRS